MLGHVQRQKAHHYFDLLDHDEDGAIEAEDFDIQAQRLTDERDLSDADQEALREQMRSWWRQLCATADVNDNDQISRSEWEDFWTAIQRAVEEGTEAERTQMIESLEQSARVTFRAIDASGSGAITEVEYADWLAAWGAEGSATAFEALDRNGDGTLSEADLEAATREFYLSNDADAPGTLLYGTLQ